CRPRAPRRRGARAPGERAERAVARARPGGRRQGAREPGRSARRARRARGQVARRDRSARPRGPRADGRPRRGLRPARRRQGLNPGTKRQAMIDSINQWGYGHMGGILWPVVWALVRIVVVMLPLLGLVAYL